MAHGGGNVAITILFAIMLAYSSEMLHADVPPVTYVVGKAWFMRGKQNMLTWNLYCV